MSTAHRCAQPVVQMGNVITLTPPLNLTLAQMDAALHIIDAGLAAEGQAG